MRRVQLGALGSFAVIAFVLAAVGIHGLLSFAVSNRTQEIGVRIALGARRSDILRMILREGAALAAAGIAIGAALAYGAGQELRALLAGLQPADAATFASAAALCFFMAAARNSRRPNRGNPDGVELEPGYLDNLWASHGGWISSTAIFHSSFRRVFPPWLPVPVWG